MSKPYEDPYAALELPRSATGDAIKRAYFALVRAHPPEREPEIFKRIRAAYERLRDPEKRAETDMLLLQPWPDLGRKRRPPRLDGQVHREDLVAAARALSDLERTDWREHQRPVKL
jgi:curved DNA-binding protein CbpA